MSQPPLRQGLPILPPVNLEKQTQNTGYYNLPPINNGGQPINNGSQSVANGGYNMPSLSNSQYATQGIANNVPVAPAQHLQPPSLVRRLNIEDALTYLDQVKSYYQNNSEIYNNFLDIMKDFNTQKIDTPGVIDRVSSLFGNNPTLIQGFNTFLPPDYNIIYSMDPNDPAPIKITTPSGTITRGINPNYSTFTPNAAVAPTPAIEEEDKKLQEPIEMDDAINYVNKIKIRFIKKPEIYNSFIEILQTFQREQKPIQEVFQQISVLFKDTPDLLGDFQKFLPDVDRGQNNTYQHYQTGVQLPPVGSFPPLSQASGKSEVSALHERLSVVPSTFGKPQYAQEITFFNQVKAYIGNKEVYNSFLKLINLYSNELIDKPTLIDRAYNFIGKHSDLFDWIVNFVGYNKQDVLIKNKEQQRLHFEYNLLQACGPSYRKLPAAETFAACSGRDDMCWNVLNDEWVGHPTWASEDSGFVAHKKNQYEEILFKIEEERHEYDYYLEANVRTIQTLETIAKQILAMSPEEKERFNLRDGLRSSSQTIYKKVIRKVYGDEQGLKVIEAVQNTPIVAIPIVLRRLKLKDEEWKRAHREWNKVWREQEQKVYFKSLDHLGLSFRKTDKKYLNPKQLVIEINGLKLEELHKKLTRPNHITDDLKRSLLLINPQLSYKFDDENVLVDIVTLTVRLLQSYTTYSQANKEDYSNFLILFVQLFFNISPTASKKLQALKKVHAESSQESSKRKSDDDSFSTLIQDAKRQKTESLLTSPKNLKELLSNHCNWARLGLNEHTVIELNEPLVKDKHGKREVFNLFGNTNVYVFIRLIATLYERLVEIKKLGETVNKEIKYRKETPFAKSLNLVFSQFEHVQQIFSEDNVYEKTLELVTKLIDGVVDHQVFEEVLRQAYWNKAYKLFSVHRVLQDIVNYIKKLTTSNSPDAQLLVLFEEERKSSRTTVKDQIIYESNVRKLIGTEENLFKISYSETTKQAQILLIGNDDLILKKNETQLLLSTWQTYLSNYLSLCPSEKKVSTLHPFIELDLENVNLDIVKNYKGTEFKVLPSQDGKNCKIFFGNEKV